MPGPTTNLETCSHCAEEFNPADEGTVTVTAGRRVATCTACEELHGPACSRCGTLESDAGSMADVAGELQCTDCAHESGYEFCETCDTWTNDSPVFLEDVSEIRCGPCARRTGCYACPTCATRNRNGGETWRADGGTRAPDGETYCDRHADGIYQCDGCGDPLWEDDVRSDRSGEGCYCEGCVPEEMSTPVSFRPTTAAEFPSLPEHAKGPYTFGVEIEAVLPVHPDGWELTDDASVSGNGGHETVSPVLSGTSGLRSLYGAVSRISRGGAEPVENGGVHVHVGAGHLTAGEMENIYRNWESWGEDVFSALVPGYRWESGYCASMHRGNVALECDEYADAVSVMIRDLIRRGVVLPGERATACLPDSLDLGHAARYVSLNPKALGKHGTLEFRIFPSAPDDATAVTTWTALCVRFLHVARTARAEDVRATCDRYGTLRAGFRILCRGSDVLRNWARETCEEFGTGIPSRYSTRPASDPWGTGHRRTARRAETMRARRARAAVDTLPTAPGGTPFLFPLPLTDKEPEFRDDAHVAGVCQCEVSHASCTTLLPFVWCPSHGLREFGCADLPPQHPGPFVQDTGPAYFLRPADAE